VEELAGFFCDQPFLLFSFLFSPKLFFSGLPEVRVPPVLDLRGSSLQRDFFIFFLLHSKFERPRP